MNNLPKIKDGLSQTRQFRLPLDILIALKNIDVFNKYVEDTIFGGAWCQDISYQEISANNLGILIEVTVDLTSHFEDQCD